MISISTLILVFAGVVLFAGIFCFWKSLGLLFLKTEDKELRSQHGEDAPEAMLPLSQPEEEARKHILLQLRDLDREKELGRTTEDDYQILRAKYMQYARDILHREETRLLPFRSQVDELIEHHFLKTRNEGKTSQEKRDDEKEVSV